MLSASIGADDLDILRNPVFDIPKVRPAGEFGVFLSDQFRQFFGQAARFRGSLAERLAGRDYWMRELASTLEAVVDCTRQGRHERAWQLIEGILDEHLGALQLMSLRHAYKVIGSRSWYRLSTWQGVKTRRDMFHVPFEKRAASYRFSAPGRPALYLGNNVYVCWLECQCEQFEPCHVARFETDVQGEEYFLDLPANHAAYLTPLTVAANLEGRAGINPVNVMNSPYLGDVEGEVVDYLALWPLLMACTVQKLQPAPDDPPEYLIPQLLMRWVLRQRNMLGIRYFTSRFDRPTNSNDLSINVVLPARTDKAEGFCDFLVERVRCTAPQTFADAANVTDEALFTCAAADGREAASDRYMIHWNGALQEYQHTPFGRMEYWLDRPELAVARIDETA